MPIPRKAEMLLALTLCLVFNQTIGFIAIPTAILCVAFDIEIVFLATASVGASDSPLVTFTVGAVEFFSELSYFS